MDKKNKKPKRTFIPQSIGDTLRKVNRNFSSKFGKIEFIIHSKWPDIVGSYFKIYSEPKNITRLPDYENDLGETIYKSHLNVNVAPAAALEFQHFKDTIIEKINSYFGYKAINDLRIQQNYLPRDEDFNKNKSKMMPVSLEESELISNEIESLQNNELKDSLMKLGKNIVKEVK
jgi:hypothetical protein|tara:strand:+ start:3050 stop:3571 length:522 start_codon:yes stop_codon:yes gene_type:complete